MLDRNKLLLIVVAALSLTACGRNKFTGTYTGTQSIAPATSTNGASGYNTYGNYGYGNGGMNMAPQVTLNLTEQGDIVQGDFTTPGAHGKLTANAQNSQSLTNVQITMISDSPVATPGAQPTVGSNFYLCGGFLLTGTLSSPNNGDSLTGTLTGVQTSVQPSQYGGYSNYGMPNMCGTSNFTLIKNK